MTWEELFQRKDEFIGGTGRVYQDKTDTRGKIVNIVPLEDGKVTVQLHDTESYRYSEKNPHWEKNLLPSWSDTFNLTPLLGKDDKIQFDIPKGFVLLTKRQT